MAQLSVVGTHITLNQNAVRVIIFDSITSNTEIKYAGTNVRFYKYEDATLNTNPIYPTLSPDDATGYIIKVDDIAKDTIWVIDYSKYKPVSIEPDPQTASSCDGVNLLIDVPVMSYKSPTKTYALERDFTIKYDNQRWGSDKSWAPELGKTVRITLPASSYLLQDPLYANTTFTLSGDQYAEILGVIIKPVVSKINYIPIAVKCYPTTVISPRSETNEGEFPNNKSSSINFSAPIDIQFLSNANLPATTYYLWEIFRGESTTPLVSRIEKDQRYTFVESGTYKVRITVGSTKCSYSDSITVTVSESALDVPIVFTPNGDELNDEFRVAYKSLATFECWVFNRWGRQVFYWNDPQKGWNGKINGKDAPAGPYFYIIKAYGTDYNPKSKPDPKTKLRVGEHARKGDINLLRGKGN